MSDEPKPEADKEDEAPFLHPLRGQIFRVGDRLVEIVAITQKHWWDDTPSIVLFKNVGDRESRVECLSIPDWRKRARHCSN